MVFVRIRDVTVQAQAYKIQPCVNGTIAGCHQHVLVTAELPATCSGMPCVTDMPAIAEGLVLLTLSDATTPLRFSWLYICFRRTAGSSTAAPSKCGRLELLPTPAAAGLSVMLINLT
jgi:hypothetical protein